MDSQNEISGSCGPEKIAKASNRLNETRTAKRIEKLRNEHWRISERRGLVRHTFNNCPSCDVDRVKHEFIRVLRLHVVSRENVVREILDVERHKRLSIRANGRCQHVSIVRVRELETFNEVFKSCHQAIRHRIAHQRASAIERGVCQVGTVLFDAAEAFVENLLRPACANDARIRDPHEQVAKLSGVQHAGVVDDNERHLTSVPEAVLLRFSCELVKHCSAPSVIATLVVEHIGGEYSPMRSNAPIWNRILLE